MASLAQGRRRRAGRNAPQPSERRVLVVVGLVMFVEALMFSALAPLLPRFEHELSLGNVGAGVLAGCFALGVFVGAATASVAARRYGGKPVLAAGTTTMLVASVLFGLAHHVVLLDAARVVQGLGGGMIWAGGLTWAAASAAPERRATATGAVIGVAVAGTVVGPPLGGLAAVTSTELVFAAIVPVVLLVALVLVVRTPGTGAAVLFDGGLRDLFRRPHRGRAAGAMWGMLLPAIALGLLNVLGPLRLDAAGAAVGVLTLVYIVAGAAEGAASPLAGRLADRGDADALVRWFLLLLAVELGLFTAASGVVPLAVAIVALGGSFGLLWAPAISRTHTVAQAAGVEESQVSAAFTFCFAGGQIVGGTGGGALADLGGDALPCLLLVAVAAVTALLLRSSRPGPSATPEAAANAALHSRQGQERW